MSQVNILTQNLIVACNSEMSFWFESLNVAASKGLGKLARVYRVIGIIRVQHNTPDLPLSVHFPPFSPFALFSFFPLAHAPASRNPQP